MSVLLLGGTADGRRLATQLHQQGMPVIYSVAGLVRLPEIDCASICGGFTQFGGLGAFIKQNSVKAILDVTHPYAKKMSDTAVQVASTLNIPCWRFHRPAWVPTVGDQWHSVSSWEQLLKLLLGYKSVFLTCGQLSQAEADGFKNNAFQLQLMRTAVKPKIRLLQSMSWLKAIGPFCLDDELAIMRENKIDVLVCKNSGGSATSAKLTAARELGIPVFMLERPQLSSASKEFASVDECRDYVLNNFLGCARQYTLSSASRNQATK